jgi:DNA-binding transcriptional ArsR family regulator
VISIEKTNIKKLANLFQLLSEENRLKILFALEEEALSVTEITKITDLSQPLVSFHLKALEEAGLIIKERKSTFVFNKICDPNLIKLIKGFINYGPDQVLENNSSFPCPPWK